MKQIKQEKGITLVALVIAIIVLLILAGVTINLTLGENGLIKRAKESANAHKQGEKNDIEFMNNAYEYMEQYFNANSTNNPPPHIFISKLTQQEKEALENNGIRELEPNEITNENLKDNENIKGVITGEVPITTGFYYKEGTKETGVVITDGTSEFVWVPVPKIEEMAVLQAGSTQNYQGVLYDFNGTTVTKREIAEIGNTDDYREPDIITEHDGDINNLNIINDILGTNYTQANQFKESLQIDFNKMAVSVKKYGGFYVGRYEASIDVANKRAYTRYGTLPSTSIIEDGNTWYGLYAYQKKMAETNGYTSVESSMIWGSNYDAMLRWALTGQEAHKVSSAGNAIHDPTVGIYETGKETVEGKKDKINNIYDLEGNGFEWTAEAHTNCLRTLRGGDYGNGFPPSYRNDIFSRPLDVDGNDCSRPILYIK